LKLRGDIMLNNVQAINNQAISRIRVNLECSRCFFISNQIASDLDKVFGYWVPKRLEIAYKFSFFEEAA